MDLVNYVMQSLASIESDSQKIKPSNYIYKIIISDRAFGEVLNTPVEDIDMDHKVVFHTKNK